MKAAASVCLSLLLVTALATAPALAQNPIPFQHIVLIIQENRTPDNLFGSGTSHPVCGLGDGFETGVDIQDGGPDHTNPGPPRCLTGTDLNVCWDIDHSHSAWNTQARIDPNSGKPQMDNACSNLVDATKCDANHLPPSCPQYSYIFKPDVQPYFDVATNYGFANYMFATNQGPSYPAHQFLLTGTSAPTPPGDANSYYLDFVADNGGGTIQYGCEYPPPAFYPPWVDYKGFDVTPYLGPCYDHSNAARRPG